MPYNRNIFDYLPQVYGELLESRELLSAQEAEFKRLNASIDDVLAQYFVDTATWGLAQWERVVGVPTDASKPIAERRSVIKARLRGAGVVTVAHLKDVAESWYGGETEVREEYAEYKIVVKFVSSFGVPSNLSDVERALREIIPAHLALAFEFKFLTYDLLRDQYATYNVLTATGLTYGELKNNEGGA